MTDLLGILVTPEERDIIEAIMKVASRWGLSYEVRRDALEMYPKYDLPKCFQIALNEWVK